MTQRQTRIKRRYTTIRLSDQDIKVAEQAADLLSMNRSEFIREAIQRYGLSTIRKFTQKEVSK